MESVRLLVWDLDDTFWKGTVTEGGIEHYVRGNHDIVIELARRGIMSSICSKNDMSQIRGILEEFDILEYFVFPSISWEPKGPRLSRLIDTVQLRAATVMFIDDNPSNRAEAEASVAGLQVEDETFIPRILGDPRFRGKDDPGLSRLKQYKLLEARKHDEGRALGGNEAFLRNCDIRVCIDYDVAGNIDRAIELVNRTNQLNYTKKRLPEDAAEARRLLLNSCNAFNHQAGLVRVADKYGDYGFVGFFEMQNRRQEMIHGAANSTLVHYCFSCRTLGMFVEHWLYGYLRRPQLDIVGDVLVDLSEPRSVDWIRLVPDIDAADARTEKVAPEIVVGGGCESHAVGVYLKNCTDQLRVYGNYPASGLFVRLNSAVLLEGICRRTAEDFAAEADVLGLPIDMSAGDIVGQSSPGSALIFNVSKDAGPLACYRHRSRGWLVWVEPAPLPGMNLVETSQEDLLLALTERVARQALTGEESDHVISVSRHLKQNYDSVIIGEEERVLMARDLIGRMPSASRLVIAMDHHEARNSGGTIVRRPQIFRYTRRLRELASEFAYVEVVSFSEVIRGSDEIQRGGNHYDRPVYLRFAEKIVEVLGGLAAKP